MGPTSGGQRSIPKPASRIVLNRAASTAGSTAGTDTVTQPESSKLNRYALKEKQTDSDIKSDARNPKNERMSGLKPPSGHSRSVLSPGGTGQDRVRGRGLNENKTNHTRSDSASSKESSKSSKSREKITKIKAPSSIKPAASRLAKMAKSEPERKTNSKIGIASPSKTLRAPSYQHATRSVSGQHSVNGIKAPPPPQRTSSKLTESQSVGPV